MTKYLLMKAETSSEWDNCAFALVSFTPERLEYFKNLREEAVRLKVQYDVAYIAVYSDEVEYFSDVGQLVPEHQEAVESGEDIYIELNETIVAAHFSKPEQDIRHGHIHFHADDAVYFTGYGKHTDEEFRCNCSYAVLFNE